MSIKDDLYSYPITDLIVLAKFHGLDQRVPMEKLLDEIAAANGQFHSHRAEMGGPEQLSHIPVLEGMVPNLSLADLNRLCQTDRRFAKACRESYIWRIWIESHRDTGSLYALLKQAMKMKREDIVKLVLELGGDTGVVKYLNSRLKDNTWSSIKHNLDTFQTRLNDRLLDSARNGKYEKVVNAVKSGANNIGLALHTASYRGHLNIVKYLVTNAHKRDIDNALPGAALGCHLNIVQYLVEAGADVDNGYPLAKAAEMGCLEIVKFLVEHGANVHAGQDLALVNAALTGQTDIVQYLVEQGADIHVEKDLSLRWAAEHGHLDIVKFLIDRGANIYAKNSYALQLAARNGHTQIVRELLAAGNYPQDLLDTVKQIAATQEIRDILDKGAAEPLRGS